MDTQKDLSSLPATSSKPGGSVPPSCAVAEGSALVPEAPDMTDDPEYQAWVESMAPHCHCSHDCPCAGVLAGGLCDDLQDDPLDDDDETPEERYDREVFGDAWHTPMSL